VVKTNSSFPVDLDYFPLSSLSPPLLLTTSTLKKISSMPIISVLNNTKEDGGKCAINDKTRRRLKRKRYYFGLFSLRDAVVVHSVATSGSI
jgi:hypothetical protein